jgi:quinol monooxygenase YgiN
MYGTVAKLRVKPGVEDQVIQDLDRQTSRLVEGFVSGAVYRTDDDPQTLYLAVVFESKDAYVKNAETPEQDAEYRKLRELLETDPEWHDGEVISLMTSETAARA